MVNSGLVSPIVKTTSKSARPAVRLRGIFITGESCEILSSPEKARNEAANPIRIEVGASEWLANILGKSDKNSPKEICVKTVTRMAISLRKAMTAPTKLTFALSLMPTQNVCQPFAGTNLYPDRIRGLVPGLFGAGEYLAALAGDEDTAQANCWPGALAGRLNNRADQPAIDHVLDNPAASGRR